jgi:hypothetical protein
MNATRHMPALTAYLSDVATNLSGPRRRRERILAELRDGLDHAVDHHTAAGLPEDRAVATAIDEFGRPRIVADAFAAELAVAHARHTVAWYIATGPLVGIWWLLLLNPRPWHTGVLALLAAIPVVPLIVVAIGTAAGTFATTGRLMRWLPEAGPRRALAATITVAALALVGDLIVIVLYGRSVLPVWPLGTIAVTASLIRMVCGITTVRRAFALRRRIPDAHL